MEVLKGAFVEVGSLNLWHPLTTLSHALDAEVFGIENAGGHHAINVFWHAIAALGLFYALRALTGNAWLALAVALIWAIHPQRVQSVAWITQRKDVLAGTFVFWGLWSWLKWRSSDKGIFYSGSLLLFVAACLSKPSVVPFPFFVLAVEWLRNSKRPLFLPFLPFITCAIGTALLAMSFQSSGTLAQGLAEQSLSYRAILMPASFGWYLQTTFWPWPGMLWVYPPVDELTRLFALYFLATFSILFAFWQRAHVWVAVGFLGFFAFWLPVSGLVPLSFYYVADRYSYLSQPWLILVCVSLVIGLSKGVRILIISLVAVVFAIVSEVHLQFWIDGRTLFKREAQINPRSVIAMTSLAEYARREGDWEEVEELARRALVLEPASAVAMMLLGDFSKERNDAIQAEVWYQKAIQSPLLNVPDPYFELARTRSLSGLHLETLEFHNRALARFPSSPVVRLKRGTYFLTECQNSEAALTEFKEALALDPRSRLALQGISLAAIQSENYSIAEEALRNLIRMGDVGKETVAVYRKVQKRLEARGRN